MNQTHQRQSLQIQRLKLRIIAGLGVSVLCLLVGLCYLGFVPAYYDNEPKHMTNEAFSEQWKSGPRSHRLKMLPTLAQREYDPRNHRGFLAEESLLAGMFEEQVVAFLGTPDETDEYETNSEVDTTLSYLLAKPPSRGYFFDFELIPITDPRVWLTISFTDGTMNEVVYAND